MFDMYRNLHHFKFLYYIYIYFSFAGPVDRCMKCSEVRWENLYFKKQR